MFARVTGGRAPLFRARASWIKVAGWLGDVWGKVSGHEPDVNSAATSMSALPHHFSSDRAKAELGYQSRPAEEAARAAWEWFQEHGYVKGARSKAVAASG
jgi:dihydroflavonol-4-reductase